MADQVHADIGIVRKGIRGQVDGLGAGEMEHAVAPGTRGHRHLGRIGIGITGEIQGDGRRVHGQHIIARQEGRIQGCLVGKIEIIVPQVPIHIVGEQRVDGAGASGRDERGRGQRGETRPIDPDMKGPGRRMRHFVQGVGLNIVPGLGNGYHVNEGTAGGIDRESDGIGRRGIHGVRADATIEVAVQGEAGHGTQVYRIDARIGHIAGEVVPGGTAIRGHLPLELGRGGTVEGGGKKGGLSLGHRLVGRLRDHGRRRVTAPAPINGQGGGVAGDGFRSVADDAAVHVAIHAGAGLHPQGGNHDAAVGRPHRNIAPSAAAVGRVLPLISQRDSARGIDGEERAHPVADVLIRGMRRDDRGIAEDKVRGLVGTANGDFLLERIDKPGIGHAHQPGAVGHREGIRSAAVGLTGSVINQFVDGRARIRKRAGHRGAVGRHGAVDLCGGGQRRQVDAGDGLPIGNRLGHHWADDVAGRRTAAFQADGPGAGVDSQIEITHRIRGGLDHLAAVIEGCDREPRRTPVKAAAVLEHRTLQMGRDGTEGEIRLGRLAGRRHHRHARRREVSGQGGIFHAVDADIPSARGHPDHIVPVAVGECVLVIGVRRIRGIHAQTRDWRQAGIGHRAVHQRRGLCKGDIEPGDIAARRDGGDGIVHPQITERRQGQFRRINAPVVRGHTPDKGAVRLCKCQGELVPRHVLHRDLHARHADQRDAVNKLSRDGIGNRGQGEVHISLGNTGIQDHGRQRREIRDVTIGDRHHRVEARRRIDRVIAGAIRHDAHVVFTLGAGQQSHHRVGHRTGPARDGPGNALAVRGLRHGERDGEGGERVRRTRDPEEIVAHAPREFGQRLHRIIGGDGAVNRQVLVTRNVDIAHAVEHRHDAVSEQEALHQRIIGINIPTVVRVVEALDPHRTSGGDAGDVELNVSRAQGIHRVRRHVHRRLGPGRHGQQEQTRQQEPLARESDPGCETRNPLFRNLFCFTWFHFAQAIFQGHLLPPDCFEKYCPKDRQSGVLQHLSFLSQNFCVINPATSGISRQFPQN